MQDEQSGAVTAQSKRRIALRVAQAGLVLLFLIAALLGSFTGVLVAFAGDVPEISARLDDYRPNTITRILARDGQTVAEFATERRIVVGYNQISPNLRNAIIATEDAGFRSAALSRCSMDNQLTPAHRCKMHTGNQLIGMPLADLAVAGKTRLRSS